MDQTNIAGIRKNSSAMLLEQRKVFSLNFDLPCTIYPLLETMLEEFEEDATPSSSPASAEATGCSSSDFS